MSSAAQPADLTSRPGRCLPRQPGSHAFAPAAVSQAPCLKGSRCCCLVVGLLRSGRRCLLRLTRSACAGHAGRLHGLLLLLPLLSPTLAAVRLARGAQNCMCSGGKRRSSSRRLRSARPPANLCACLVGVASVSVVWCGTLLPAHLPPSASPGCETLGWGRARVPLTLTDHTHRPLALTLCPG
jgi:hypothetical protein